MADRYWVGGTGNWSDTAGNKWATTSGGTGGASVPTAADDVFFDANSGTGTVTIATGNTGAKSINCTGFTGTLVQSGASITISGSLTLSSGMTYTVSGNGELFFAGTGTVITAGKTIGNVRIDAVGITVTLGDSLILGATRTLNLQRGTFNTNNYNATIPTLSSSASTARAISLGSSTLSTDNINFSTSTNLTFDAGTSQINFTPFSSLLTGGTGVTFNNVAFTFSTFATTHTISGANTFNNLSVTAPSSAGVNQVTFNANQIINGTLSTTGTAGNRRVWFRSDTYGVRRTLTVNSAPSLTDADFRDIIVNGTAAPISGTRIGNRGACTGITFDAPKTVYWAATSGTQNWSGNFWASSSGGTPNTDNSPLAQDIAIIDNASGASGIIFDYTNLHIPNVNMSSRTSALTISFNNPAIAYGNWTNGSGITLSGTSTLTFSGEGTKTITSAGKTFSTSITIDAYGGTVELADALNAANRAITVTNGIFDTKGYGINAQTLSSDNNTVRTIKLGASSISLSGGTPIGFNNPTNLTFDAGTSQINVSSQTANFTSTNQTFYNVSFTSGSTGARSIIGANTFNNLTLTASATGLSELSLTQNQTINGTLTVAGSSATQRAFVRSGTIGTTRTLTVNSLSANDCDFRDITIAGTAAGSSPTRAGDCGGNSGITFPAPKTVYWNLAGTQDWSATGWATSSGGTPAVNNFPLAQDTAVFDNTGAAGTITLNAIYNIGTIDSSTRSSAMTLTASTAGIVYGSINTGSGVTYSLITITFSGAGTQTLTTNGKTFQSTVIDKPSGVLQLGSALTLQSNTTLTLTRGSFDAVSYNVTAGFFELSNNNTRTLNMGSGLWTAQGTSTCWNLASTSGLTFLKGTADILLSDTSTSARTFAGGGLSYNKLTIGGATGTSTLTITGNNQFTELASTKTVAHTIDFGTTAQTFGKWTVTGSAGNVVTLTGTGTSHTLVGSATSGIDYLAMGSIGFAANSTAEFYAGANSTGTASAPVFRTAAPTPRTLYWVGGTGNWSDTARWSTSSGGSGGAGTPTSLDNVVFDSASNATAYTVTVNASTGGNRCNSLTISAPASGNVTLAGSTTLYIHGNVILPATGLTRTFTGAIALTGSTTGKTFTTNGVTLASNISVFGVGCGWTLGSALNNSSSSIFVTHGSFDTGNYNITSGPISSSNSNSRTISLGSSTLNLASGGTIAFDTSTNLTFNAGTSQINLSDANASIHGGTGQTFYNVSFTNTNIGAVPINGVNTFNNLTVAGKASAGVSIVSISANQTINGTLTLSAGTNATCRTFVRSDTIGTTRTLTCNAVSATDVDFRDITIAGSAAPISGTRLGDCKGNSGITFPAPKTVYFRGGPSSNWGGVSSWSFTNGGSSDVTAFPLAQDTAIFPDSPNPFPPIGGTAIINAAYNIGTIDMSARTSNTMTLDFSTGGMTFYGDFTNGTGVTLASNATANFSGRNTQTITSAGRSFAGSIVIDSPSGTVQLADALSLANTLTLTRGTFDAVTYGVTTSNFVTQGTLSRTLNMGSGLWTITGSSFSFDLRNGTNLTVNKGTADIILTEATSASKTFGGGGFNFNKLTFAGAGTGSYGFNGNNSFTEIASTKSNALTITLGNTTQRVGAFTVTGTAGNVVTITGTGSNLIYTGAGTVTGLDYLNIQGRAFGSNGEINNIWYGGANSVNSGSLGWVFAAGTPPTPASNSNFFLMFA